MPQKIWLPKSVRERYAPKKKKTCSFCGIEFLPNSGSQRYCSVKCSRKAFYKRLHTSRFEKREPKPCIICGSEFMPKSKNHMLCGKPKCKNEYNRRKRQKYESKRLNEEFSHGTVYVLDMSLPETEWEWQKEERG